MSRPGEQAFRDFLKRSTGFVIPEDRWKFLAPKFLDRLDGRGFPDVETYLYYLENDPLGRTELEEIFSVLTVRKTSFFRNPASYDALGKEVLPNLAGQSGRAQLPLCIWSAGCSTGEEPYSLAMLAKAVLEPLRCPYYILASDIVKEALARAREGIYSEHAITGVPPEFRHHLELVGGRAVVRPEIRQTVEFIEHNLVHDRVPRSAVGHWDVILCRNVFIYFSQAQAKQVLRRFTRVLAPGGALFLGHAEVFTDIEDEYEVVFWGDTFYYRKRLDPRVAPVRAKAPPLGQSRSAARPRIVAPPPISQSPSPEDATRRFKVRPGSALPARREVKQSKLNDSGAYKVGATPDQLTPTRAFRRDGRFTDETRAFQPSGQVLPRELLVQAEQRLRGKDLEGAARTLRAAISRAPRWAEPRLKLAQVYIEQGEATHAVNQLETAVEVEPLNHEAHHLLGKLRALAGDHARAEASFRRALYLRPQLVRARYDLAQTYRALGHTDRACRELRNVIRTLRGLSSGSGVDPLGDGTPPDQLTQKCQAEIMQLGGSLEDSGVWRLPPRPGKS